MKTDTMRKMAVIVLFFMVACSPRRSRKDEIAEKIAVYFSEPVDSVKKGLELVDSSSVKSMGLKRYFFRRWYTYPPAVASADSQMYGDIIFNIQTGNWYISAQTVYGNRDNFAINMWNVKNCMEGMNYFKYGEIALPERVLNDLPVEIKKHLSRNALDSFFRNMGKIDQDAAKHCVYPVLIDNQAAFDNLFESVYIRHPLSIIPDDPKQEMKQFFKRYVDSLFMNGDEFYLYHYYYREYAGTGRDYLKLITINDEFKDTATAASYYHNFTNEPRIFKLNIYRLSK